MAADAAPGTPACHVMRTDEDTKGPLKRVFRWLLLLAGALAGLSIVSVLAYRFFPPPVTPLMLIRAFDDRSQAKTLHWEWRSLDDIAPSIKRAVIASEDMKFCDHWGFDFEALEEAWQRYRSGAKGARLHGGSTITMQTAKNVFLWPSRRLLRKAVESWFTVLIEALWSKDRILEVYLNVVEWGDGVFGVEAAAQHHFGRPASRLTNTQAARLAAVLPNPRRFDAGDPSSYIARRTRVILGRMGHVRLGEGAVCP